MPMQYSAIIHIRWSFSQRKDTIQRLEELERALRR